MKHTRLIVKMPDWWVNDSSACSNPSETILGLTDGVVTYCCSSEPCYYVEVPEFEYEGYFKVSDLVVIAKEKGQSHETK